MKLIWYGTASLMLEEEGVGLAFDPFMGIRPGELKKPPEILPYEKELRCMRNIFITHGHFDHIYHLPRLYAKNRRQEGESSHEERPIIYCTETPKKTLLRRGMPEMQFREIQPGTEVAIGPFTVRCLQGRHCRFDFPLILRTVCSRRFFRHPGHLLRLLYLNMTYPENKEILFYEVICAGKRVQIMGSMNLDQNVSYPTGADLLILPLQGRSDADTYALNLVRRLQPKKILLDHYDNTFEPLTGEVDVSGFVRNVWEEFHIPCRPLRKGETVYEGTEAEKTLGRQA